MLKHEHDALLEQQDRHSAWPVRIIFAVFAIFFASGIVATWEFVGHNGYIIVAAIIPLAVLCIICSLAAFTATRRTARDFVDAILSLFYFWP